MDRKLNNVPRKDSILKLRGEGKSYNEISKILGCSKSTIAYHCDGGKEKKRVQELTRRRKKICRKVSGFKSRCSSSNYHNLLKNKVGNFKKKISSSSKSHSIVNNVSVNYSCQDVIDKIGENPICYLTGTPINLNQPETYNLDHVIPTAKGGSNNLDNLQICLKEANSAKGQLSCEELYDLCEKILHWKSKKK